MSAADILIEIALTLFCWAVQSVSRGLYSQYLPLVPVCARVKEIVREGAEYTVHFDVRYLYFGRVGMAWSSDGIYNMEKQLVGY